LGGSNFLLVPIEYLKVYNNFIKSIFKVSISEDKKSIIYTQISKDKNFTEQNDDITERRKE
jgi:hypothetical protein